MYIIIYRIFFLKVEYTGPNTQMYIYMYNNLALKENVHHRRPIRIYHSKNVISELLKY